MRIPFVGPSKEARSLNASAERTINCYLEFDQNNPRVPAALYGLPGLVSFFTLGTSPVRGSIDMGGSSYWVAGNTVYRVTASGVATTLGTIATTFGDVGMAQNGRQVAIVDGEAGWIATSSALTMIDDIDFPNGVTRVTSQDGYFIFVGDGTERIYINETPRNGAGYTGTDYTSAEGSPDKAIAVISSNRVVWVFGTDSLELYENTGNPDFPFERSQFVEQGCAAAASVAAMDNTVYWLGRSEYGQGIVFKGEGYTPRRISDHAMETAIAGYSVISDARAFCFQVNGHAFYVLTFPTADHTWIYDAATGLWTEWLWRDAQENALHRHRANCCTFINGQHLVGDWETGEVYRLDQNTYTDDGAPILRLRRTQTTSEDGKRLFFGDLQIEMETGVGAVTETEPQLMLRYSNDGGHTWSNTKHRGMGAVGEYGKRVKYGPTGSGRNRVWEISTTDPVKWAVFGATVDVTKER